MATLYVQGVPDELSSANNPWKTLRQGWLTRAVPEEALATLMGINLATIPTLDLLLLVKWRFGLRAAASLTRSKGA